MLAVYNIMSRQVHQNKIKIKYLSWDWPWLSLHACLDLHPDRSRCRRSRSRQSRHDRHPKFVNVHDVKRVTSRWLVTWSDVQDVELITDSSSCHMIDVQEVELVLGYWLVDVIAVHVTAVHVTGVHVIMSMAETSRHVNIVVRDAIIMSTSDSWQHHHDVMNSFRFSLARLCQHKLFPGIISKASQSSYKSILF
jgi:hypothetical protein